MPVTPRKRKGSLDADIRPNAVGSNISLPPPKTPTRGDIDKYFSHRLCPLVGRLPYGSKLSPEKRPKSPHHDAVEMVKFLYFQSQEKLFRMVDELEEAVFQEGLDSHLDLSKEASRFNTFYEQLQQTWQAAKSSRMSPDHNRRNADIDASDMPPPAATRARGVLFPSATKSNLAASTDMDSFFTSNTAGLDSATTSFASTARSSNGAFSSFTKSINSLATGLTSAVTSFTSDAAAKTVPNTPLQSTQDDEMDPIQSTQDDAMDCSSENFGSSFDVSTVEGDTLEQQAEMATRRESPKAPRANVTPSTRFTDPSRPVPMPHTMDTAAAQSPSVKVSPSKSISYRIRDIPLRGLAPIDLPEQLHRVPFHRRLEAYRVMRATSLKPDEFVAQLGTDPSFSKMYSLLPRRPAFKASETFDLSRSTVHATLQWSPKSHGPAFDFTLQVPQRDDLSAFQRKFGADRFLVVKMPSLDRPPSDYRGQETAIAERVLDMLKIPQAFLGRSWVAYHHSTKKHQITFFAVGGVDIGNPVSISTLLNWLIPFEDNRHQPACKASARLDLGQSRTRETVTFEHDQVHRVRDLFATKDPSPTCFDDPALVRKFRHHFDGSVVMNDGCNEISYAAMVKVQESLKLDRPPAVVQARIFGAKGLWYRSADEKSDKVYIKISGSQTKIKRRLNSETDPAHLQLGVLSWSRPARPSLLYPGFLPILQHRGVPAQTLLDIACEQVNIDTTEFLACLTDRKALRQWVHKQKDLVDSRVRDGSVWNVGGCPNHGAERICMLTESGFDPDKCKKLADEACKHGTFVFDCEAKRFRITLSQSTSVLGIADPTGTLKPGEIYLAFSHHLKGSSNTGASLTLLDGEECLVARNPAMRDSDIQKVRAVYRTELSHLQDVVVFPSRGNRPLADMLSGGDYDGDTFWICWDSRLVSPFKNAPTPLGVDLPPVESFGITRDKVELGEIVKTRDATGQYCDAEVLEWINKNLAQRFKKDLLGIVTLTHGELTCGKVDIATEQATWLVALHDFLVDGDKQGYRYNEEAWRNFKRKIGIPANLRIPAHRYFTRPVEDRDARSNREKPGDDEYNKNDIIDRLYFEVVWPEVKKALQKARDKTRDVPTEDSDLSRMYCELRKEECGPDSVVPVELKALRAKLKEIRDSWAEMTGKYANSKKIHKVWETGAERIRQAYKAIAPVTDENHPTIKEWLRQVGHNLSLWEQLKASAFAHEHHIKHDMIFIIAGFELCQIKAFSQGLPRVICEDMWLNLRPKKRKADDVPLNHSNLDDSDADEDSRSEYASDSMLDAMESIDDLPMPNAPPVPPKPLSWNNA